MERAVRAGTMLCALITTMILVTTPAQAAPGAVAAYGFNEGAGTAVADASGAGNHGTATATGWAPMGRFGGALSFNGSSSFVTVPDSASLDLTTGMTLEAWVNPTALGTGWRTAVFKQTSGGMVYSLYAHNGSRPAGQVNIGGEQNAIGPSVLPPNTWTHLAVTYDRSALRLYVNGNQVASKAQTGSIPASTGVLRIGGNSIWNEYFAGLIDEVRVYPRALAASEIQADMTTPVSAPAPDTQPPTAPAGLRQTGATDTSATIAWSASTDDVGVTGYGLYRAGSPAGSTAATTTTIGGLACGTSEVVGVDAFDAAGNRSPQATVTVTTEPCAPEPEFVNERVIVGLDEPTALTFTPDGRMLVAERDGTVWVAQPGAATVDPEPFLQLPSVATDNERGLLGIELDPDFAQNGYLYAFYTHGSALRNRVSRFEASGDRAPASSEQVIWQNAAAADVWHQGGDLHFGPDGHLYVSVGDHLRSDDAQRLDSANGKILRMRADGSAPADNPFYDGDGPNVDTIWVRGLRNPFRFTIDGPTGRMIVADVGQSHSEEINVGVRGANYGWPACEGPCGTAGMTNPVHSYPHASHDASVTGGFVYRGSQFPASYRGDYFFADYAQNWIKRLSFDAAGNVTAVHDFEPPDGALDGPYGDIVALAEGPDGSLWYLDAGPFEQDDAGSVRRIRSTGANRPPTAQAAADRTSGPAPLTVAFSSAGSADPEGRPLTYRWDFGDGTTSTEANPTHTFDSGRHTVRLTTSDGEHEAISAPIAIAAGSAPTARILSPAAGQTFRAGDVVAYSGEAGDPDDGPLTGSRLTWKVVFHHDGHIHPVLDGATGGTGTLTIPSSGHSFAGDTSFELVLTATDSDGLTASQSVEIEPQKAAVSLATSPAGLGVTLDGIARTTPFTQQEAVGFRYAVDAPSPQFLGADRYTFASWSDGGARSHAVTVPAGGLSLTASFARAPATLPGLVAAYSFDDGAGTTLADRSGRGHPGTLTGGPVWSGAGRHGGALSFDGVDDHVRIADHPALDLTTAMTLEAWVRPSALGSTWRTVVFKEQASHMTYALYAGAGDSRPTGQAWVGGERDARAPSAIPTGSWTHLAVTYDGGQLRLYVNGTEVRALAVTGAMAVSGGPLKLGGNGIWREWFAGLIDDVRIYDRALTPAEIQSDMATPVP